MERPETIQFVPSILPVNLRYEKPIPVLLLPPNGINGFLLPALTFALSCRSSNGHMQFHSIMEGKITDGTAAMTERSP
jgi:hypothetical protein